MKMKKIVTMLCTAALLVSTISGCTKNTGSSASSKASAKNAPTLVWWTIGMQPANLKAGLDVMNKYTAKKIGVKVDIKVASWGDWDTKMNTIINSGEAFDMMFTTNKKYVNQVSLGAFADITDSVQKVAPDLYKAIPTNVWNGIKIGGKYYSVPTYKDSSVSQYWAFDDTYVKKYNLDISKITTMQELDTAVRKIKSGEGSSCYPVSLFQSDGFPGLFNNYDDLAIGLSPIGVKIDDSSRKVVSTLEQPDIMKDLKLLHSWYKDGIINPSAPTQKETSKQRIFISAQGFPGAETTWQVNDGVKKYDTVKVFGPEYTTSSIQGSMNAISANSKYKTEALKYLQLVNTDSKLRNMLAFGIEGTNFEYKSKNVVKKLNDTWTLPAYAQGTFFDMATTDDAPADEWKQVKALNEKAENSTCLGFAFNASDYTTEVANCSTVWDKYKYELLTGASDPTVMVPKIVSELKKAGMSTLMSAAQKQLNSYFK